MRPTMDRVDEMDAATERRALGLLGLGIRARNVVVGVEQVRLAARKGKLRLALVAPDASVHSRKKLLPLLEATRVKVVEGLTAATLGSVAGREATAAIGVTDAPLANGLRKLFDEEAASAGAGARGSSRGTPGEKAFRRIG